MSRPNLQSFGNKERLFVLKQASIAPYFRQQRTVPDWHEPKKAKLFNLFKSRLDLRIDCNYQAAFDR